MCLEEMPTALIDIHKLTVTWWKGDKIMASFPSREQGQLHSIRLCQWMAMILAYCSRKDHFDQNRTSKLINTNKLRVHGITDSESVSSSTNAGLVLGSIVTVFSVLVSGRAGASIIILSVSVPQRRTSFDPIGGLLYEMVGEL